MSGVMAGSAILAARTRRTSLGTVTLTINNTCNLTCSHCYLQYSGREGVISPAVLDHLFKSDFDRVCIVGKEPLADHRSVTAVCEIVERATEIQKAVSVVSNGLNGRLLPDAVLENISWMDVSLDGGERTYEAYRRGSWTKLRSSIDSMRARGLKDLRLLQTLSTATAGSVTDMVEAALVLGASVIMFSPYQPTRSHGTQTVAPLAPSQIVQLLHSVAGDRRIYLSFDAKYASRFDRVDESLCDAARLFGDRFIYVDSDPVDRGIVRVTYDGLILTPFEAANTDDYQTIGRPVLMQPIGSWFSAMLSSSQSTLLH